MIGVMTASISVLAQIAIPMPLGVPMTMQTFAIMLTGIILGPKKGSIAALIYILIGALGVPVFANFTGGYQCIAGPNGGFLLSFPLLAFFSGLGYELRTNFKGCFTIFLVMGNILNLVLGTIYFCLISRVSFAMGLASCVLPFLIITVIKILLAATLGSNIRKRLIYT